MLENYAGEIVALAGITLGFLLGEGSRLIQNWFRMKNLKKIVRNELMVIKAQLQQKKDILRQAIVKLDAHQILPTLSVHFLSHGYDSSIKELCSHLSREERQCLHVIYEYLRVGDLTMDTFEQQIITAIQEKVMADPYSASKARFEDILKSFETAERLIDDYLKGRPPDVFAAP